MAISSKNKIVTIGLTGFPYSFAPSQKLMLMGKALIDPDTRFYVICNTFIKRTDLNKSLKKVGRKEGLIYFSTSTEIFSPDSIIKKALSKFRGLFNEFIIINRWRKQNCLKSVFIYSKSSAYCFFWSLYFKIYKVPSCLIYFELISSFAERRNLANRLNDFYYDRYNLKMFSGIITISQSLVHHINKVSPGKKIINIPPLVDIEAFSFFERKDIRNQYFLYCGTLAYFEVIDFIIESYSLLKNAENYFLYLVLNGNPALLDKLKLKIKEKGLQEKVKIFSNLKYEELIQYYLNSFALLIPLRDIPQDTARFPQKVAEYCAAKRPVLTTRIGELPNYFDDTSMIFSDKYDVCEYAAKMEFVIKNPEKAEAIGLKGFETAKVKFNYTSFSGALNSFISNL